MPSANPTAATTAGITTSAEGTRVIPSSTRADGSTRREIRVRPGYRPPEDVEIYKNRTAEAWKNRGTGGVPGAESLSGETSAEAKTGAAAKNAKRREARKRAKAADDAGNDGTNGDAPVGGDSASDPAASIVSEDKTDDRTEDEKAQAEREKKAKKLKKKLREARELQAKKEKGEGLLQEQLDKVIKIKELMRDLEKLGLTEDDDDAPQPDQS